MPRPTYSIRRWDELYETGETRKLKELHWFPFANSQSDLGFRRIVLQKNRSDLFAAWVLILQIASVGRTGQRGTLVRDGRPLDAEDMSLMTGFPAAIFEQALTFFSDPKLGWIAVDAPVLSVNPPIPTPKTTPPPAPPAPPPAIPAGSPASPADSPATPAASDAEGRKEGRNGMEWKEGKEAPPDASGALPLPEVLNTDDFIISWQQWIAIRRRGKKPKTSWEEYFAKQLAWLATLGSAVAIETVATAARNEWTGLHVRPGTGLGTGKNSSGVTPRADFGSSMTTPLAPGVDPYATGAYTQPATTAP